MSTIFVITHKPSVVNFPAPLRTIHVGAAGELDGALNDRQGDSIAERNPFYGELTAQYWIWKNLLPSLPQDEKIGFCHYRRFFTFSNTVEHLDDLARIDHKHGINQLWRGDVDVILAEPASVPVKQHWWSYSRKLGRMKFPWEVLTLGEHFQTTHVVEDLRLAMSLLPKDTAAGFESYLNQPELSAYNMYIAAAKTLDQYFSVLFPWLFALEEATGLLKRSGYQQRLCGFIAERFSSYYFHNFHKPAYSKVSFIA